MNQVPFLPGNTRAAVQFHLWEFWTKMLKKNLNKKFEQEIWSRSSPTLFLPGNTGAIVHCTVYYTVYYTVYKWTDHCHQNDFKQHQISCTLTIALVPQIQSSSWRKNLVFIVCVLIQAMTRGCMLDLSASRHLVMVIRMMANDGDVLFCEWWWCFILFGHELCL